MTGADVIASDNRPRPPWHMYRAMVGTGIACALLIVAVYLSTGPAIERNRAAVLQRAVLQVLPGATRFETRDIGQPVYVGFTTENALAGMALEASAMGYADTVRILYGYDPARQAVVGLRVLESKETPGLGDRIETDPVFTANFKALDVRVNDAGTALANPIELVKPGEKNRPWQIDGISGATISSAAIAAMLRDSAGRWVPELHRQRDTLSASQEPADAP